MTDDDDLWLEGPAPMASGEPDEGFFAQPTEGESEATTASPPPALRLVKPDERSEPRAADGQRAAERHGVPSLAKTLNRVWSLSSRTERGKSLATGVDRLDRLIGGYRPRFVTVLGAETNWGKSSFAIMAVDINDRAGSRVLLVSAEDSEETYGKRLAARRTGLSATKLRDDNLDEFERDRLFKAAASASATPWFFDAVGKSAERTAAAVTELCREERFDLVIVDYLQAFTAKAQDRRNEVTTVARLFADAIKTGGAAGLMLSQLKRLDGSREPNKFDLKESGDIENAAEHIIIGAFGSHAEDHFEEKRERRFVKLDKNKDGPKHPGRIWLSFDDDTASFREVRT